MQKTPHILFTKSGFEEKKQNYEDLVQRRKGAVEDLRKAREMGDLSENGYYKAARFNLSSIDRQIRHLTYILRYGKIATTAKNDTISIGCDVTIQSTEGEKTYSIVGDYEANPSESKISSISPIGRQLLGKRTGDTIIIHAPAGEKTYTILSVTNTSG